MNLAKIQVSGVRAVAVDAVREIPAGIVGATVKLEYTGGIWAGLNKTVIFRGNTTKEVLTDETTVTVPAEVVAEPRGRLRVGVYGTDAANNLIMPTLWAELGVIADAAEPSEPADSALPIWAQLYAMIGNLGNLDTAAKSSLVAAVNELVEISVSGGNGNQGTGLSTTAANLLIEILESAVYSTNVSGKIASLKEALLAGGGSGGDTPDVPDVPVEPDEPDEPENPDVVTYTVTNNLTNVVNSNGAASANEGASYTATLTAVEGYTLDTVTVTMGGVDITNAVYLDGVVSIATVSGDIVITATAKALPVEVEMSSRLEDVFNTTIYSDDGATSINYDGAITYVATKEIFLVDTEVTVTVETNGVVYPDTYVGCYESGFPLDNANKNTEKSVYHATVLFKGGAYGDTGKAGTYTKKYTVKAGYGLILIHIANSVYSVTRVTVMK